MTTVIPLVAFAYDRAERQFSAEISELPELEEDGGFTILNPETGVSRRFVLQEAVRNEGDYLYWEFRSTNGEFTAIVFND